MNPNFTVYHLAAEIEAGAGWGAAPRPAASAPRPRRRSGRRVAARPLVAHVTSLLAAARRLGGRGAALPSSSIGA